MADQKFRTTLSVTFWTESPEDAEDIVDTLKATLPREDRDNALATVEYIATGRQEPADMLPPAPAVEESNAPPPEPSDEEPTP